MLPGELTFGKALLVYRTIFFELDMANNLTYFLVVVGKIRIITSLMSKSKKWRIRDGVYHLEGLRRSSFNVNKC